VPEVVRVLIVDDQESYRSAVRLVVSLADGFEVVGEAADGETGVDMAFDLEVDLVLMDINMPGIDGLEATRRIAERGGPTVLVLSTYEAAEFAEKARTAGAIGFISKADFDPFTLSDLWARTDPGS
jgi:DNA-binding NarL/FixJ family response regulator